MNSIDSIKNKRILDLAVKYDFKPWLILRYSKYIPDLEQFLDHLNQQEPSIYIRTNTIKISPTVLCDRLLIKGFKLERTSLKEVFLIKYSPYSIASTTEYLLGYYYLQDLSSCLSVEELDISEDLSILDMAASPGGKTTFIAQKMNNTGSILALEPNKLRLKRLFYNLERCGVMNTCIWNIEGSDILNYDLKFDRVLLDAPCSCDGIIQKDINRKKTYTKESIQNCSKKQNTLLNTAIKVTKPGGLLIYSTCSLAPEENEFIINDVLPKYDINLENVKYGLEGLSEFESMHLHKSLKMTKRFYPHIHKTNGFFIAKLRKID
ncbi:MAG: NOL1/NOP2/sun family putative RNA methylase [Nitrososphaeraceae archaeon]|nr:NOL1/NOP2/sun family putative RNA methylase [Nitrososphaeraceae archaeon]